MVVKRLEFCEHVRSLSREIMLLPRVGIEVVQSHGRPGVGVLDLSQPAHPVAALVHPRQLPAPRAHRPLQAVVPVQQFVACIRLTVQGAP